MLERGRQRKTSSRTEPLSQPADYHQSREHADAIKTRGGSGNSTQIESQVLHTHARTRGRLFWQPAHSSSAVYGPAMLAVVQPTSHWLALGFGVMSGHIYTQRAMQRRPQNRGVVRRGEA